MKDKRGRVRMDWWLLTPQLDPSSSPRTWSSGSRPSSSNSNSSEPGGRAHADPDPRLRRPPHHHVGAGASLPRPGEAIPAQAPLWAILQPATGGHLLGPGSNISIKSSSAFCPGIMKMGLFIGLRTSDTQLEMDASSRGEPPSH